LIQEDLQANKLFSAAHYVKLCLV